MSETDLELEPDVLRMIGALARDHFRRNGDEATVIRLRSEPWRVVVDAGGDQFAVLWTDGDLAVVVPAEDVAAAVGLLRARQDARRSRLN